MGWDRYWCERYYLLLLVIFLLLISVCLKEHDVMISVLFLFFFWISNLHILDFLSFSRFFFFFEVFSLINLLIYFWLHWVFIAACRLYLQRVGATLCFSGFSCGVPAVGARASVVVARGLSSCGSWALQHRLSSCGAQA